MKGKNMFCRVALGEELEQTHRTIRVVELAARGEGVYPQPVPCLATLQRYAVELADRLRLATFPPLHPQTN